MTYFETVIRKSCWIYVIIWIYMEIMLDICENTWLNTLPIMLLLTLNINKRCCRMFIWYTFKVFNSFIKSLDEIETLSDF